jgi:glycosyltransferase involved in cell wall biosynthesis
MTIAIDYNIGKNPEELKEVFGLQVAVFSWLKAYFRYGKQEKFIFLIDDVKAWGHVQKLAEECGLDPKRLEAYDRRFVQENYKYITTVFRADPVAQEILWRRESVNGPGYNFCGLAHAIGGLETGNYLEQYCLAPAEPTDAIISPSRAVQSAIRTFFDMYEQYIQQRFRCDFRCQIQLPVIPLGIDVEKFIRLGSADKRVEQRRKLNVTDDETVLLWVGRLSHAIKAHPLSMYQAAERAAEMTGAKVHLVMLGYFIAPDDEEHFRKLAEAVCTKAKVTFVPNKDERFPDGLWAAGDIFLSLIDNMQESFGLTPIEAMAAGLPRVITDWDGYRDSVTDGEDGFLIRTLQPPAGMGGALSRLLLDGREEYGGFLAKTALSVAVDQEMASTRIATLIRNPALRRSMAEKARQRAQSTYDWSRLIPRYEVFWEEMAAKRQRDRKGMLPPKWPSLPPQVPDPFTMYESYPTATLKLSDRISVSASTNTVKILLTHKINTFAMDMMIAPDTITRLLEFVSSRGTMTIQDIFKEFSAEEAPKLWRTLAWQIKLGILRHQS